MNTHYINRALKKMLEVSFQPNECKGFCRHIHTNVNIASVLLLIARNGSK